MPRPIGYYVHHQGDGHRQRALAIASQAQGRIILLGTNLSGRTGGVPVVELPDDRAAPDFDGCDGVRDRPAALHYAPVDHDGVRRRTATIAAWIAATRPALMVVDVSAEVAMLARLAATTTVYVRLSGRRDDPAHLDAFRGARRLIAPFAAALDDPELPAWIRDRTIYAPGLIATSTSAAVDHATILVVTGRGGQPADGDRLAAAARATPDLRWHAIGPCSIPRDPPSNLRIYGWVEDAARMIASAGTVIGGAGDGLIGAVLAAGRPFVCLPESRAYGEQHAKACRLAAARAALVLDRWPSPAEWRGAIERARNLVAIPGLHDPHGPERAARALIALADHDLRRPDLEAAE